MIRARIGRMEQGRSHAFPESPKLAIGPGLSLVDRCGLDAASSLSAMRSPGTTALADGADLRRVGWGGRQHEGYSTA
jgi:hypothetical protein